MMGIRKGSNLWSFGRFGIGPLVMGGVATWLSSVAVRELPQSGNAWLALTMSTTMTICGLGAIVYGWWLDRRNNGKRTDSDHIG